MKKVSPLHLHHMFIHCLYLCFDVPADIEGSAFEEVM